MKSQYQNGYNSGRGGSAGRTRGTSTNNYMTPEKNNSQRKDSLQTKGRVVQFSYGVPVITADQNYIVPNRLNNPPHLNNFGGQVVHLGHPNVASFPASPLTFSFATTNGNLTNPAYKNLQRAHSPFKLNAPNINDKLLGGKDYVQVYKQLQIYKQKCSKLQNQNKKLRQKIKFFNQSVDQNDSILTPKMLSEDQHRKQKNSDRLLPQSIQNLNNQKKKLIQQIQNLKKERKSINPAADRVAQLEQKVRQLQRQKGANNAVPPKTYLQAIGNLQQKVKLLQGLQLKLNSSLHPLKQISEAQRKLLQIYERKLKSINHNQSLQQIQLKNIIIRLSTPS